MAIRQKAERFHITPGEEVRLADQENHEDTEELRRFWEWEEESLTSPFAFRVNPTKDELEDFVRTH